MKLQQIVAECNTNINILTTAKVNAEHEILLPSTIGMDIKTTILIDNILIFGPNSMWNEQAALLMQKEFASIGILGKIINIEEFFSLTYRELKNHFVKHIIICDDMQISPEHLAILAENTGTKIIFKIPGIKWKKKKLTVHIGKAARRRLQALNIDSRDALSIGLLASLTDREFCITTAKSLTKRVL